jgi:hypothetical protein
MSTSNTPLNEKASAFISSFGIDPATLDIKQQQHGEASSEAVQRSMDRIDENIEPFDLKPDGWKPWSDHPGGYIQEVDCFHAEDHSNGNPRAYFYVHDDGAFGWACHHGHRNTPGLAGLDKKEQWVYARAHMDELAGEQLVWGDIDDIPEGKRYDPGGEVVTYADQKPEESAKPADPDALPDYKNMSADQLQAEANKNAARVAPPLVVEPQAKADTKPEDEEREEPYQESPIFPGCLTALARTFLPDFPLVFKLWALIDRWGLLRSGLDTFEGEPNLQPRFYCVLISPAGRGKTACIVQSGEMMEKVAAIAKVTLPMNTPASFAPIKCMKVVDSGESLGVAFYKQDEKVKQLIATGDTTDAAAKVIIDCDELRALFEKAKGGQNSSNMIHPELLKLYSGNFVESSALRRDQFQLDNAHLAILSGATPISFSRIWVGTGAAGEGLQSRFTLIASNAPSLPTIRQQVNGKALVEACEKLAVYANLPPQVVKLSPEAEKILVDFWDKHPKRDTDAGTRVLESMKQLFIVLTVSNGLNVVSEQLAKDVTAWADTQINARERLMPPDATSPLHLMEMKIKEWMKKNAKGNPVERRDIARGIHPNRFSTHATFNLALDSLVKAGWATELEVGRGKAKTKWYSV